MMKPPGRGRDEKIGQWRLPLGEKTMCRVAESNHGHEDFQSSALPTELTRHLRLIHLYYNTLYGVKSLF